MLVYNDFPVSSLAKESWFKVFWSAFWIFWKIVKKCMCKLKKIIFYFLSKIAICIAWPPWRTSKLLEKPSKEENYQHFKTTCFLFLTFFFVYGSFFPTLIRIQLIEINAGHADPGQPQFYLRRLRYLPSMFNPKIRLWGGEAGGGEPGVGRGGSSSQQDHSHLFLPDQCLGTYSTQVRTSFHSRKTFSTWVRSSSTHVRSSSFHVLTFSEYH
jgi:hypothetical protein